MKKYVSILYVLSLMIGFSSRSFSQTTTNIVISIDLTNSTISVGDKIGVHYVVLNNTSNSIRFGSFGAAPECSLYVKDMTGKKYVLMSPETMGDTATRTGELKAGGKYDKTFSLKLKKEITPAKYQIYTDLNFYVFDPSNSDNHYRIKIVSNPVDFQVVQ